VPDLYYLLVKLPGGTFLNQVSLCNMWNEMIRAAPREPEELKRRDNLEIGCRGATALRSVHSPDVSFHSPSAGIVGAALILTSLSTSFLDKRILNSSPADIRNTSFQTWVRSVLPD